MYTVVLNKDLINFIIKRLLLYKKNDEFIQCLPFTKIVVANLIYFLFYIFPSSNYAYNIKESTS